jgi:DNA-directed RNA polymerase subunit RPC12/RpoP
VTPPKRRHKLKTKPKPKPKAKVIHFWKYVEMAANKLGIECPHCGGKAVVNRKDWLIRDRFFTTRGCTYCDWWATIPIELLPVRDPRRDDSK